MRNKLIKIIAFYQANSSQTSRNLKFSKLKWMILFGILFGIVVLFYIDRLTDTNQLHDPQVIDYTKQKNYLSWKNLSESYPVLPNSQKLENYWDFPDADLRDRSITIGNPMSICVDDKGNTFISDHTIHTIYKFDELGRSVRKLCTAGDLPGQLLRPRTIRYRNGRIYVLDIGNRRIQIFKQNGSFIKSFKIFKPYIDMAINSENLIYLSPYTSDLHEPLIEVLNESGTPINYFGKRILFNQNTIAHNEVYLSISPSGDIFVAWRNFPIVRRYSKDLERLSEFEIEYGLLKELARPNYYMKKIENKIKVSDVIRGLLARKNRFYLLITKPRIEILAINLKGIITESYWSPCPFDFWVKDFCCFEKNNRNQISFYLLCTSPIKKVQVFLVNTI